MAVRRVLLIRHGQTDWNVERRWQGMIHEVPLNEIGRQQAKRLSAHLQERSITLLYSSDLLRAWETALILGKSLNRRPQADERWRERDVGVFQGLTWDEVVALYPKDATVFESRNLSRRIPGGESRMDLRKRSRAAWDDLVCADDGSEEVGVVSHGGTIRSLLLTLFPDHSLLVDPFRVPNTSITTLEPNQAGWCRPDTPLSRLDRANWSEI